MEPTSIPSRSTRRRRVGAALALVAALGVTAAACGSSGGSASKGEKSSSTTAMSSKATTGSSSDAAMEPSGPACSSVPAQGAGSFSGMAQDPAATAASNNPALSTLVSAVMKANLADTLNGTGPFTIFAPANSAFEKIPTDTLNAVLADQAKLTDILTYHVIAGKRLSSTQLEQMGHATTVEGKDLSFSDSGGTLMVNGQAAGVCVDVPTANATVHIIDTVLMPPA